MQAEYSVKKIAEIIHAATLQESLNTEITELIIDSRAVNYPNKSIFFAIVGERNNGHNYITELYEKGVRNFVIQEKISINFFKDCNILRVDNTLQALQMLAAFKRKQFSIPVIGITGSNGKTIVKEWLYQLLNTEFIICRSPKSYNSQVGVPLSVWQLNEQHTLGIFEAGISEPHKMNLLEKVIAPTIGIFTNIGNAHNEGFENLEQKVAEKFNLFKHVQCLIYCKDYALIHTHISNYNNSHSQLKTINTFTWSKKNKADLVVSKITHQAQNTHIQAVYNNSFVAIKIPFTDAASIENAINCWCAMIHLGIEQQVIEENMLLLSPVAMRLELKEAINNCLVINDFYNSDINSLSIALDYLNAQPFAKKTLIISDILQTGLTEQDLFEKLEALIKSKNLSKVIGIGNMFEANNQAHLIFTETYKTTDDFIKNFDALTFNAEAILLKGARVFQFEKISELLQQKSHETILEINLNALLNNYNFYRSKLKPNVKMMAMVKAFSYGSGSYEVANLLQYNRVDYLAVAYADEGVELRKRGIKTPIMVMNITANSFSKLLEYDLEPEIYSKNLLAQICNWSKLSIAHGKQLNIHLKIDTGMHRLGFMPEEVDAAIHAIKINGLLKVTSVFSHLVASDNTEHDNFSNVQIKLFDETCALIETQLNYTFMKHILNSGGITRFVEAQYSMVRIGIGLYGISNTENEKPFLENVCTLKTIISQIKKLETGNSIGYSRAGKIDKPTQTATIPIGYADGFSRSLGNGNYTVLVNGKEAKTIGNICMDMSMLDITNIVCEEGDEVIIFGNDYKSIYDFADALHTITYEALTGISERVKRIFVKE